MPGRQWCVPGRREVRELLIVGIGVALGHLVKDCRHGKTVGGLCREGRVERKEHSYREYDVWRCLDGSVVVTESEPEDRAETESDHSIRPVTEREQEDR